MDNLFDFMLQPPISPTNGPDTSKAGEKDITASHRKSDAQAILERLKRGPATKGELIGCISGFSLTQRISDLRHNGYDIECLTNVKPYVYVLKG